jgi:hypothetical protein
MARLHKNRPHPSVDPLGTSTSGASDFLDVSESHKLHLLIPVPPPPAHSFVIGPAVIKQQRLEVLKIVEWVRNQIASPGLCCSDSKFLLPYSRSLLTQYDLDACVVFSVFLSIL